MMYEISEIKDEPSRPYHTKSGCYSDNIYTFDIESTSMFYINGEWQKFDYSIEDYSNIPKMCCPYIGMFSINDKVYYFRNMFTGFVTALRTISNPLITKTVWVHNLAFDHVFYEHILDQWTITDVVARDIRHPISFKIQELNIVFRCSLRLVEMSLEKAAKQFTDVEKASGDLDYTLLRSPKTELTELEMYYCEMDCVCLYKLIQHFKKEYKHIKSIPLTQTGIMRRAYAKIVPPWHNQFIIDQLPDLKTYKLQRAALWGGITHGNILYVSKYLKNATSYDIASSYPFAMCAYKYPSEKFQKIDGYTEWKDIIKDYPVDEYAILSTITYYNIEATTYNHYIPYNKCFAPMLGEQGCVDNGRLVKADRITLTSTEIDKEIIDQTYIHGYEEIEEVYVSKKKYLPKYYIEFLLDLYCDKTKLKNVAGMEHIYNRQKQILNSSFGANIQNPVTSEIIWNNGGLAIGNYNEDGTKKTDDEIILETLEKKKKAKNNLFCFHYGVYITAYARKRLFSPIINNSDFDKDVIYYDTDSLKFLNGDKYKSMFEDINKQAANDLKTMCKHYHIDYNKCNPIDPDGIHHPLGAFEYEGTMEEFCTLGAKRYCYRQNGKLKLVVAGVGKAGITALNDNIKNFNKDTFFDYEHSGKLMHSYIEKNPIEHWFTDYQGNKYYNTWKSGIVLEPTTYSMKRGYQFIEFLVNAYNNQQCKVPDVRIERKVKHG